LKINEKKKEQLKAKVELMIIDLIAFEKEPGVKGMPTGVYVHDAKRELVRLVEHL
jgi:hypothetical protein